MFLCFALGECLVSCSQASKPDGGKQENKIIWNGLVLIEVHRLRSYYMSTSMAGDE